MLKRLALFTTLILALSATYAVTSASYDFSGEAPAAMMNLKRGSIKDGLLAFRDGGSVAFDFTANQPYKVRFRCRMTQALKGRSNSFFSINLMGDEDYHASFMLREDMMVNYLYKNGQRRTSFGGTAPHKLVKDQWQQVEIAVMKNFMQFSVDNQQQGTFKHQRLIPLTKITFGTYCMEWELDDLQFELLEEVKPETIQKPILTFDFNDNPNGIDHQGKSISPSKPEEFKTTTGIDGTGLLVEKGQGELLEYELPRGLDNRVGGIMFWVRAPQGGHFFRMTDGKGRSLLSAHFGNLRYTLQIAQKDSKKTLNYLRTAPGNPGDWVLVALTWDPDGKAHYFINSLPYVVCFTPMQRVPDFIDGALDEIKTLQFQRNKHTHFAIDRLQLFQRTLTNADVYNEYRRFMPIDMVVNRGIFHSDEPVVPEVQLGPAGYYTRPMPIATPPANKPEEVALAFTLADEKGNTLLQHNAKLLVDSPMDLKLPAITLPPGKFRLECTVNGHYSRSWNLVTVKKTTAATTATGALKVGKEIYRRDFAATTDADMLTQGTLTTAADGTYLEMGINKFDRMSVEIPFPQHVLGKPVALDITWPDDKARLMGWYMYAKGIGANRDRLQSGVSAGNEFPSTNRMVTTRHIFYPGVEKYLFECRTLAAGMPAAVARIQIFELPEGLPALQIHKPANLPARHFGFYDEDQTFTNNLNVDAYNRKSPAFQQLQKDCPSYIAFFTNEMVRYFKFTGMDTAHLPLWRYDKSYFPLEGQCEVGMYPGMALGSLDYVIDALRDNGIRLIANMNYQNLPDINTSYGTVDRDFLKEGLETLDNFGDPIARYLAGNHKGNIAHPDYFKILSQYFDAPLKRYAHNPGFGGLEVMMAPLGVWMSLEYGYDDWTVKKFSADTGVKVQTTTPKERFQELTTTHRAKWLKWRSEQVTAIVKSFRDMLDKYNPQLKLFLSIPQDAGNNTDVNSLQNQAEPISNNYVNHGIDIQAIKAIPRTAITVSRSPTAYRHGFFWGKPESEYYGELYNADPAVINQYLTDGVAQSVLSGHTYFETFVKPLSKDYPCYFEDADIKPHSRWYLRELAFAVAAFDAQEYVAGGQPLNTIGRDEESREFAQAYRALPARPFTLIPGLTDPVVARYLHTQEGTYFYAVNLFHGNVTVEVDLPWRTRYTDLSTGESLSSEKITLKPFQLRSFLIKDKKVTPKAISLKDVEDAAVAIHRKRLELLQKTAQELKQGGLDVAKEEEIIAKLGKALEEKRYAEAYRLSFTKDMNQLLLKSKNFTTMLAQQQQMEKGHIAINCGSATFYKAPNGTLFFPDQKFDGKYGYEGRYTSITRDIEGLKGTEIPELYKTEAYDLERYRFILPNGKYKVVLYMKAGFQRTFQPKNYIFTLKFNGKPLLHKYDLFTEGNGDFTQSIRKELAPVEITDGKLLLEWNHEQAKRGIGSTTVCLLNAIEIIRIK